MYDHLELARYCLEEFERGLEGLNDMDARRRLAKADGTEMNGISWIAGHVAWHFLWVPFMQRFGTTDEGAPYAALLARLHQFRSGSDDPEPPALEHVLDLLQESKRSTLDLVRRADDTILSSAVVTIKDPSRQENVGTKIMRCSMHALVHAGEVNAIRQIMGHETVGFVSMLQGRLEWRSAAPERAFSKL
jgi:hypothetical protein